MDKQRFLGIIKEVEAGLKYRQEIEKFKQSSSPDQDDGPGGATAVVDIKALQEEAENKYGRWQS